MASPRILQVFRLCKPQAFFVGHNLRLTSIQSARFHIDRSSILPRAIPLLSANFTRRSISTQTGSDFPPEETFQEDVAGTITDAVSSAIPPLQYGDLASAGLVNWGPTGVFAWSLEALNVSTGLPWFWTIVGGTVLWRILLLPIHIMRLRQFSLYHQYERTMPEGLKADIEKAIIGPEKPSLGFQSLEEGYPEHTNSWFSRGLHPPSYFFSVCMYLPPLYGGFFGLLRMCQLPVAQLAAEGLAAAPEGYILPAVAFSLLQMQLIVSRRLSSPRALEPIFMEHAQHAQNAVFLVLHAASSFAPLFLPSLPVATLVQLCVFSLTSMLRSWVFTLPKVREYFDILPQLDMDIRRPSLLETYNVLSKEVMEINKDDKKGP